MDDFLSKLPRAELERAVSKSSELGGLAFKRKEWDKALEFYETAVAGSQFLHHENRDYQDALGRALSNRSACRLQQKDYQNAVSDARACVELMPRWQKGWFRLGHALLECGMADKAEAAFAEGIQLDMSNEEMIRWRAKARNKLSEQRGEELKKRRYKTDYSKFDDIVEEVDITEITPPTALRSSSRPVVETVEEMHDYMAKKQQALLDAQPPTKAAFNYAMLSSRQNDCPRELDEPRSALGGLVTYLSQSTALQAPKRRLHAALDNVLRLCEAIDSTCQGATSAGVPCSFAMVGCGDGRSIQSARRAAGDDKKICVFSIDGPYILKAANVPNTVMVVCDPLEDSFFKGKDKFSVLVLDDSLFYDVGLLGSRVLPYVRHCRHHICQPCPVVLPRRAGVFITPALITTPGSCGLDFGVLDDHFRWHLHYEELEARTLQSVELLADEQECFGFDFDAAIEELDRALPLSDMKDLVFTLNKAAKCNALVIQVKLCVLPDETEHRSLPRRGIQYVDPVVIATIHGKLAVRCWHNSTRLRFETTNPAAIPRTYSAAIARWHFDMVADRDRNEAFDAGLRYALSLKKQESSCAVIDFGSGTGLLSFLAEKAGAKSVVGFDTQKNMIDISRRLARINGCTRCKFVNKNCRQLIMGKDLKHKADILVMELFDYGCLGEGALHLAHFAWNTCLKENAIVVPNAATIFAQVVELRVPSNSLRPYLYSPDYYGLDLSTRPHIKLTDPFSVFCFNLNDREAIKSTPPTYGSSKVIDVKIVADGVANAVVFWHVLDLAPGVTVSTAPGTRSCWVQACQPLPSYRVCQNDVLPIRASHQGSRCTFSNTNGPTQFADLDPAWLTQYENLHNKGAELEKMLTFNTTARQQAIDALVSIAIDPARFARHGLTIDANKSQEFALAFFVN